MKKKVLAAALILFVISLSFGDDNLSLKNIRITEIVYNTDGNTSNNALDSVLEWDMDRVFSTSYELNDYLQQKRQLLINMKVYRSVRSEYTSIGKKDDSDLVRVTFNLKEAWTIIPIPYYKYDNNLGVVMGLALDYRNVGGSLTDFVMSSYYSHVKSELTLDWYNIRTGSFLMDFQYNQLWETVKTADKEGDVNLKYSYMQSSMQVSMNIPIVHELNYKARPIIRWPYAYEFEMNNTGKSDSEYMYQGAVPAYNHILEWDNVDWIGSLRSGFGASIENQLEYDQVAGEFITWSDAILTAFFYTPYISYNTRVSGFIYHNDFKRNAADRIRGILDYKLSGTRGFFWNQNTPFNIFSFPKVGDIQLSPFYDVGFVLEKDEEFRMNMMNYTTGTSLILFPSILPSFSFSIDFGINLQDTTEIEIRMSSLLYY